MNAPPPLTPAERLALSRERLRIALSHSGAGAGVRSATSPPGLLDILKTALPGASVLIDTLSQWWARHPLHSSGVLAGSVVQTFLRPVAQRHPVALVAGAMVLGAALAFSRPWRWALKPHLLSALGPALLSSVLASAAVQSWIAAALAKEEPASDAASNGARTN